jgi:hypothetical protein
LLSICVGIRDLFIVRLLFPPLFRLFVDDLARMSDEVGLVKCGSAEQHMLPNLSSVARERKG